MKVLVTGATGFFGKNIHNILTNKYDLYEVGSKDYDLLDFHQVNSMFTNIQPEVVVHLAAKVGGIMSNKINPADFWFQNMMMTTHIWELSRKHAIRKLIYILPGCCYPKNVPTPIKEEYLWDGFPDEFPAPGALAKKMGNIASYAYKKQYGLNSCTVIPGNMFGPFDSMSSQHSHVIPALLLKMITAKKDNSKEITLWGKGCAIRDFVFVEDVAKCIPYFIENDFRFESAPHLENVCNISTGKGYSIKELAKIISDVVDYRGDIIWDSEKPEGPANKIFCNARMRKLGLSCNTELKEGIEKTYQWYQNQ